MSIEIEKKRQSREIYNGKIIHVQIDEVTIAGKKAEREIVNHPGAAAIIAVTDKKEILFVKQYRYAIGQVLLEIPAGKRDAGEEPETCALRELEEETGYTGGTWEELMVVSPNPSIMNNLCYCFLARGVRLTSPTHFDKTEDIESFLRTKQQTYEMLLQGEFKQAMIAAPLWKYFTLYCKDIVR